MSEPIADDVLREIKKLTKLEISENVLKSIVRSYIERIYQVSVEDVRFVVNREIEGYGPMEHEVLRFNGCIVTLKGE